MRSASIRKQLLAMTSIVLFVISGIAIWAVNVYAERSAQKSFDRLLHGAALQISENISKIDGRMLVDIPESALETLAMAKGDRGYYSVLTESGDLITGYADLPLPKSDIATIAKEGLVHTSFYQLNYRGLDTRFLALIKPLIELDNSNSIIVIVGQTLDSRRLLSNEMSSIAFKFVAAFFVLTLSILMLGIWLVFRPLAKIKQAISARESTQLSPIELAVPSELVPLLNTINFFMSQLQNTLDRLKRLTAEAAHQMRTPLAGIRSQAQNALEEEDEQIRQLQLQDIAKSSEILTTTVNQILDQATLTHRFQSKRFKPISLHQLVQDVCREFVVWALDRKVQIEYLSEEEIFILGDDFALRQMVKTLVENAVKYSPENSIVEVELFFNKQSPALQIRDSGEGIPDSEKSKVFEPFYRAHQEGVSGSGMGLSIAMDVAIHHHAKLSLKDNLPTGLIVEVLFKSEIGDA